MGVELLTLRVRLVGGSNGGLALGCGVWGGGGGSDGHAGGHAIRCLVRWADVVERDDARSLRDALEGKILRSGHADKMIRVGTADKHAARKRQCCAVELRFPVVPRRRI